VEVKPESKGLNGDKSTVGDDKFTFANDVDKDVFTIKDEVDEEEEEEVEKGEFDELDEDKVVVEEDDEEVEDEGIYDVE